MGTGNEPPSNTNLLRVSVVVVVVAELFSVQPPPPVHVVHYSLPLDNLGLSRSLHLNCHHMQRVQRVYWVTGDPGL